MSVEDASCPLCRAGAKCQRQVERGPGFPIHFFECKRCGRFEIGHIVLAVTENGTPILGSTLLSATARDRAETDGPLPRFTDQEAMAMYLSEAPRSIPEKAIKTLLAIARRTEYFGQTIRLIPECDFPLGYAANQEEFFELLHYLRDCELIDVSNTSSGADLKLTANGFDAVESRSLCPPTTVFISSTCYDLLDLRDELAVHLEANGFVPKLSEDPYRFDVDPTEDSIETCLRNLDASDVVVCILDRRYGGVITGGPHAGLSATHTEVRHARSCEPVIPIYTFIRERAWLDFDALRRDPSHVTHWVEPSNPDRRAQWLGLARELIDLNPGQRGSNWVTPFKTVVDLKMLSVKRLLEYRQKLNRWVLS